jgi:sulfoxide reductase heme-binding subunit YedZ
MVLRKWRRVHWLQAATHVAALLPLALLIYDFARGQLTANPIREMTLRTGKSALVTLVLSLACTPIDLLLGAKAIFRLRKPLGLYAAFYAALHLMIYVVLDYGFAWGAILEDLRYRRFIQFGLLSFLLLIPLAITSTKGWRRRLGKGWKRLHRLVYLAAPLAAIHFYLLVKAGRREPLLYGVLIAALLAFRIPVVRRAALAIRSQMNAERD